jgi:hypothetical protein
VVLRYFTKADRENIVFLCTFDGKIQEIRDNMANHNRPEEWIQELDEICSRMKKLNEMIAESCSDEELKKSWKVIQGYNVILVPNNQIKQYFDQDKMVHFPVDSRDDMAEAVLRAKCRGCKIKHHERCKFRKALMTVGIPPAEDPTPEGVCQYKN